MKMLSDATEKSIAGGSMIRQMFEQGIMLKKQHGEEAVCDFSLGNPDLAPPAAVAQGLRAFAETLGKPFALGYMPNGGYPFAREALAKHLSVEQGAPIAAENVMLSCGAAGALNVFFHAVLNPGDEVLAMAPYFAEYGPYVANHGGVLRTVPTMPETFALNLPAIEAAITPRTRAVIINSPNNPTGAVYTRAELQGLVAILEAASQKHGRPVYLIADEPYRFLAFDGVEVPSLLPMYRFAVLVSSFSKNLSMPGERVGYIVLSALMEESAILMAGLVQLNRTLGFVNPPAIGQHLMLAALGSQVDASVYDERRKAMAQVLQDAGYEFQMPRGAFYFFPKAPGGDDVAFVKRLAKELVLAVPGSGFGGPGHFRLAFCVDKSVILRAAGGFKRALNG